MKIKVREKKHEQKEIQITTEFIRLDALLKFEGLAETGGHAKGMIQEGEVKLNGVVCTARGKKVRNADVITVDYVDYTIRKI